MQFCIILLGAKSSYNVWNDYNYPYYIINVQCHGNESKFMECKCKISLFTFCYHYYYGAVAVFCQKSKCAWTN